MSGREGARQTAGERLLYAARGAGPGIEAAEPHRRSGAPIPPGMSRYPAHGGLEVVPGGYGAARGGSRLVDHHPQQTPSELAPVRDGPVPRAHLLWAAAALLLEAIAADTPGDPDASTLAAQLSGLLGEVKRSAPPLGEPGWPGEPLTQSETRVLRYLPTHLGAPEIAAELYLSANTVKTHLRHLYRKLGAHSRHEAVQRAQAIGLLTASSRKS
jgi:LuxR family transcriptional regulator, maltose regulon positive regulatory protein